MIDVLIADDHPLIRKGFKQILAEASDMYTPQEASTGQEVLEMVGRKHFDIVLLDITFPDMNGLGVLKELKRKHPQLPVMMISIHPEEQYAVSAMKAGASGYLTKGSAPDELLKAVERVSAGGKWITATLADSLASFLENDESKPLHESLTSREYQVLCMIASGLSTNAIAEKLFLSNKTIFFYRDRLIRKLNLKSTSDIIRYALRHKIIESE
ncbi:MAG: response regulator transcription factor [Candidatus Eremiobacteraeota bacterium]|nr:response regulator transcription factor [Candidatus Eremiobacteraeota bacterium]